MLEYLISQCSSQEHLNARDSVSLMIWTQCFQGFRFSNIFCDVQNGVTPLMMACNQGHEEAVEMLLQSGADPNMLDQVSHAVV